MSQQIIIDGSQLEVADLVQVARHQASVALSEAARAEMRRSRSWVEDAAAGRLLDEAGEPRAVYGVNTGYGSLARVRIPQSRLNELSRNLIRSHAAGVGDPVARDASRAMVLLRANALAKGLSGCRPQLVELLLGVLNAGMAPWIPSQGSCGSSGDLAPLSHLGLLIAHDPADPEHETGQAWMGDELLPGLQALKRAGLEPIALGPKEGLAINNGAQLTTAIAALALWDSMRLVHVGEIAAAMSIEALRGVTRAFHPLVQSVRPYQGARDTAASLLRFMEGSELVDTVPGKVQDAYSLRCTPQVVGSTRDALRFVHQQVLVELNAVTDNPVICVDAEGDNKAFSAGLFHGEPVGMAADFMKIAVAELANLSERRLFRLTTGSLSVQLPASLRRGPGVGLLALQTTAAALVSENKALGYPASMDSIPTCEDQEDHVAMSTTAARRAAEVVRNAQQVVGIELLCAHRALSYRLAEEPGLQLGKGTAAAYQAVDAALSLVPPEHTPSDLAAAMQPLVRGPALVDAVREACGPFLEVNR